MKKLLVLFMGFLPLFVLAQNAENAELLSAQVAYQKILKEYNAQNAQVVDIQDKIKLAKNRMLQAQQDVQREEAKLQTTLAQLSESNRHLADAGARLDAAWSRVRK